MPIAETMQDTKKQIVWQYDENELNNEESSHDITYNMDEYVNEIHVIGTNVNGLSVYGVATNDNPESPYSVPRIGLRIGEPIEDPMIQTEQEAKDRALYELRKVIIKQTAISKQVLFNPLINVNNIIASRTEERGVEKLVVQSISYSFSSGVMSVELSNLDNMAEIVDNDKGIGYLLQDTGEFFILADDYSLIRSDG